jgi:hypothetical protein
VSRRIDTKTIVTAAKNQYENIRKEYDRALQEHTLDLRIPVKNLMENLRSALDYTAHDIYDICCKPARTTAGRPDPRNIYFPYGRIDLDFRAGLGNSLPDLERLNLAVYRLVESIQPFRCSDSWLYDFCSILNENKHDKLTAQVRTETETYSVQGEHGSVSIIVNNPNIQVTSMPDAIKIFGVPAQFTSEGIRTATSGRLTHKRKKWVAFIFEGSNVNVLGVLDRAVVGIARFVDELYSLI